MFCYCEMLKIQGSVNEHFETVIYYMLLTWDSDSTDYLLSRLINVFKEQLFFERDPIMDSCVLSYAFILQIYILNYYDPIILEH